MIACGAGGCGDHYVVGVLDHESTTATGGAGGEAASGPLVPATGAWWGYHSAGSSIPAFTAREGDVGRKFDVAKIYHDFSNVPSSAFPTAEETAFASDGHLLHISWEARLYDTGSVDPAQPAAAGTGEVAGDTYTYAQILAKQLDPYLDLVAARAKSFARPLIIEFDAGPDDSTALGGSNVFRAAAGTPTEFAAAYRHIVERFRAVGVTNVVWAVAFAGFQDDAVYRSLYPGDDVVDWIGWAPYNHTMGSWALPLPLFRRFYDRLDAGLLGSGASAKPRMLSNYACMPDPGRPDWLRAVPGALDALDGDQPAIDAFATAGHDTYVNQPHAD